LATSRFNPEIVISIRASGLRGILTRTVVFGGLCVACAAPAIGQDAPRRELGYGAISGLAVDSLRGGVLVGARVEIEGTRHAGITDSAGRFTIDSVPPGSHRLFLVHPLFDTLGLSVVSPSIAFSPGKTAAVVMAVPSARTVQLAKCGKSGAPPGSTALLGMVVTGDLEDPVEGAELWLTWTEVQIGERIGVAHAFQQRRATTGAGGRFMICGLPPDLNAQIIAWHGPDTTAAIPVAFGQSFLTLLTLGLASEANDETGVAIASGPASVGTPVRRREAVLHGLVSDVHGVPIEGATVAVDGANPSSVTDGQGTFTLRGQLSGSHRLTFRGAGYDPIDIGVNLNSARVSEVRVTLSDYVPLLK